MKQKKLRSMGKFLVGLMLLFAISGRASAEIIDDITLHTDANGETDAVIKFTVPIQYLRHFPQGKSAYTSIFFNILSSVPAEEWQDYESHRTPPSDLVQEITISTRDRGTGPKVQIKFYRPVEFTVTMGKNNQVLLTHIKAVAPPPKTNESTPATGKSGGAAIPLAVTPALPAVPSVLARSPSVPTPSVARPAAAAAKEKPSEAVQTAVAEAPKAPAASTTTAAAPLSVPAAVQPPAVPTTSSSVAPVAAAPAVPAIPVVPSGDITSPKVVLAPSGLKPVRIPLGGADGLPPFPELDQYVQMPESSSSEKLTLTAQIIKANNQAAGLMAKGGNALLTGQPFVAIAAFNDVLKLPPNKYTQDAQLWIGIAKERSGQLPKAILEFQAYLKLYPDTKSAKWVKDRLATLKAAVPAVFADLAKSSPQPGAAIAPNTPYQFSEFGSVAMYYYQGASQTNTTPTVGSSQAPESLSRTDQKSLMTNINMTARAYNNQYDNRLVFQSFYAANFLPGQKNNNRLGAAYYEMKDRIANYSVKIGRQSGLGGGVMGRFDGVSAGYGFYSDYRANVVFGQLSDISLDNKPTFFGTSLDFGTRSPLGGSVYFINQKVIGITDRRAVGGNLRYFDQRFNVISMLDYDVQIKALNMITLQGTLIGNANGTDFNFLLDRRRSPVLGIRSAVYGTQITVADLMQKGWSISDLAWLANKRTTVSNLAQIGMTNHLSEVWIAGTDFTIANTAGLDASGTKYVDPVTGAVTYGDEGYVDAQPSSGNSWTISERLTGMGIFQPRDVTNFNLSYTKSKLNRNTAFQVSNHADLREKWTLDTTLRLNMQSDNSGGKSNSLSPTIRAAYRLRNNLSVDGQFGIEWSRNSSSVLQTSSRSTREYISFGGRYDF